MLHAFLAYLVLAWAADDTPFWKAKEKIYQRIQDGEVIVSVKSADAKAPFKHRLEINGGGQARAPRDFAFNFARDYDHIARLSGYIDKAKYHPETKRIEVHVSAFAFSADLELKVNDVPDADPKRIEFDIVKGPMTGLNVRLEFAALNAAKTEIGMRGAYDYDTFPLPKMFLEFGMEVIFQKTAVRLRSEVEKEAKNAEGKKPATKEVGT